MTNMTIKITLMITVASVTNQLELHDIDDLPAEETYTYYQYDQSINR